MLAAGIMLFKMRNNKFQETGAIITYLIKFK